MMHLLTLNQQYRDLLAEMFNIFQSIIKEVIHYGQQHNIITVETPSEVIAQNIQNIYVGTLVEWVISNGDGSLKGLMDTALEHYLRVISINLK